MANRKGFSLLELLVVILIIGILAAIALPQYYRAKEKAEAAELQIMVKTLYESQQRFYMVHNAFAKTFDKLDMDYSGYTQGGCEEFSDFAKTDCISTEKNGLFIHANKSLFALRKTGRYKRSGFMFGQTEGGGYPANKLLCYEFRQNGYCSKVLQCDLISSPDTTNAYYSCNF